jgi:hypothetical protein
MGKRKPGRRAPPPHSARTRGTATPGAHEERSARRIEGSCQATTDRVGQRVRERQPRGTADQADVRATPSDDNSVSQTGAATHGPLSPTTPSGEDSSDRVRVLKEDWLRLIEERFRNALVADLLAAAPGHGTIEQVLAVVDEYLEQIRPMARRYAQTIIGRGDWRDYADFLALLPNFVAPVPVPRRRGRPATTPAAEVLAALRRYDEIMLGLQAGESPDALIGRYARDLNASAAAELAIEKQYVIAAKLAVRGTKITWNTLLHRYSPKYKTGRLHSITNAIGSWDRKGKRKQSFRWTKVVGADGREEVALEKLE